MIINDVMFNCELSDILDEVDRQRALYGLSPFTKRRDSGKDIQVCCPYHNERRPSAGIRKSDGMFHCFRGDTRVITKQGTFSIKDLCNKEVQILNGNGEWEFVKFNNYGKQSLMKLTLKANQKYKTIYATSGHEWIVYNAKNKITTQNLVKGQFLEKILPPSIGDIVPSVEGIVHGFIYGDGEKYGQNDKLGKYYHRCYFYNESDLVLKKYFSNLDDCTFSKGFAGNGKEYEYALVHANRNYKLVPNIDEPIDYILGFLMGYFVADGNFFRGKTTIYSHKLEDLKKIRDLFTICGVVSTPIGTSNIKSGQMGCIYVKEDTFGYTLRLSTKTLPTGFFITSKGDNNYNARFIRLRFGIVSVEPTDLVEDVYCCETSTHSFALEDFILTGNCFACQETHTLQELISHCFEKYDDVLGAFGWQWLLKNFASVRIEDRKPIELNITRGQKKIEEQTYVSEEELDSYRYYHPYWAKRGVTEDWLIELFDLGYSLKEQMITFPVRDVNGNCLFIAKRSVNTKFFNYPEGTVKPLYGLYEYKRYLRDSQCWTNEREIYYRSLEVYITESMIDALRLWQNGKFAFALNGLGNDLQFKQLNEFTPCRKLILATDNDEAGQKARQRIRQNVKTKIITEAKIPDGCKDIGDCSDDQIKNLEEYF